MYRVASGDVKTGSTPYVAMEDALFVTYVVQELGKVHDLYNGHYSEGYKNLTVMRDMEGETA